MSCVPGILVSSSHGWLSLGLQYHVQSGMVTVMFNFNLKLAWNTRSGGQSVSFRNQRYSA